jgi:hypothetical protein
MYHVVSFVGVAGVAGVAGFVILLLCVFQVYTSHLWFAYVSFFLWFGIGPLTLIALFSVLSHSSFCYV